MLHSMSKYTVLKYTVLEHVILFILLIVSISLIYQDIKTKTISIISLSIFGIISLVWYCMHKHINLVFFIIILCTGLLTKFLFKKQTLGTADYFISLFLSPFLYTNEIPYLLILIGVIGTFISVLIQSTKIAFIPVILSAVSLTKLLKILYTYFN